MEPLGPACEIQAELGLTNQGMADVLGCSKVSYARFPVGLRPIRTTSPA